MPANVSGAAYSLFLRARELEGHWNNPDDRAALPLYAEAIAIDPNFALAHARYALLLARLGSIDQAEKEADTALRLDPQLGEAHYARSLWFSTKRQYAEAAHEIEIAARALPTDADVIYAAARLHRRQGKWQLAVAEYQQAIALDPRQKDGPLALAYTFALMRDWPAAIAAADRSIAEVPEYMFNKVNRAYLGFWSSGDLSAANQLLAAYPPDYAGQFKEVLAFARYDFNLLQGRYEAAEQAIPLISHDDFFGAVPDRFPAAYYRGCIELARHNTPTAIPLLNEVCPWLEEKAHAAPDNAHLLARLAMLHAFVGRKEEALREIAGAQQLCPEQSDAWEGPPIAADAAIVHAWAGDKDRAIAELQHLLRTPGALNLDRSITIPDLRQRWCWDPLRADPRFQQLIASGESRSVMR